MKKSSEIFHLIGNRISNGVKNFILKHKVGISACVLMGLMCIGWWILASPGVTSIGEDITVGNNLIVNGSVGIGTTAPRTNFEVITGSTGDGARFSESASGADIRLGVISDVGYINVYKDGDGPKNLAIQTIGGRVGIGTTDPNGKLGIDGRLNFKTKGVTFTASGTYTVFTIPSGSNAGGEIICCERAAGNNGNRTGRVIFTFAHYGGTGLTLGTAEYVESGDGSQMAFTFAGGGTRTIQASVSGGQYPRVMNCFASYYGALD